MRNWMTIILYSLVSLFMLLSLMPFNDAISAMKGFFTIGGILYLLFFGAILYVVHHSQSMGIAFLLVSLYIIVPTMNDSIFAHLSLVFYALAFYSQITTRKAPQRQTSPSLVYPTQSQSKNHISHYLQTINTVAAEISAAPIASILDDDFNYHRQYLHDNLDDDFNYHRQYLHDNLDDDFIPSRSNSFNKEWEWDWILSEQDRFSRMSDPIFAHEIDNIWHHTSLDSTHHSIEDSFSHDSMNDFMHNSTDSFSHDSMNSFSHDSMNGF